MNYFLKLPVLSIIVLTPAVVAVLLLLFHHKKSIWMARAISVAVVVFNLSAGVLLAAQFSFRTGGFQFTEQLNWITSLGIHYQLGLDGLSLWFFEAALIVEFMTIITSIFSNRKYPDSYYIALLVYSVQCPDVLSQPIFFYS